ncbi:beclin-1-like protein isoform X1 [Phalaenopsis equestris]|uniref:beclin-1-like protein isoform X1 n=1 Tax=Phalaenopsis equestris TaxID=78828 RepID=UPI0009E48BAF|nr:beclin-1-like protein isoform X1 [Phalaenopsis equestris]
MKGEVKGGKGRSFPVDPNLPRWVCQNCRHALCAVDADSYTHKFFSDPSLSVQGSLVGSTQMDHSFVVLFKQKGQGLGIPPRPKSWLSQLEGSAFAKGMEESFVVLPPASASMYYNGSTLEGVGAHLPTLSVSATTPLQMNNSRFYSGITVLKKAFDIATSQTQVEQPLCLECLRILSDKLDKEVEDVNMDIKAYETCLQRSELESYDVLNNADFPKDKEKIEEEERRLQAAVQDTERQFAEVKSQKKELESKSKLFRELEEGYWHEYNNFQFQLASHQVNSNVILLFNNMPCTSLVELQFGCHTL